MGNVIALLILGIFICVLGIMNIRGNITTLHWYHRRRVAEENIPAFGRMMGIGTLVIGGSIVLAAVLQLLFRSEAVQIVILPGAMIGLAISVYGLLKYNHGVF